MNSVEKVLDVALSKLKGVADVDTVVGKPIGTMDGTVVLPVSKVSVGFVAGGGEYSESVLAGQKKNMENFPFAGGSGGGVIVTPVAFLVITNGCVQLLNVDQKSKLEKLSEVLPDAIISFITKTIEKATEKEEQNQKPDEE